MPLFGHKYSCFSRQLTICKLQFVIVNKTQNTCCNLSTQRWKQLIFDVNKLTNINSDFEIFDYSEIDPTTFRSTYRLSRNPPAETFLDVALFRH
jgi:hypothetical protein